MDLIGQSIYDYCHPCDHDELREMLALRPDGDPARSFCLRFKSALMAKKRSKINQKVVPYKVYRQTLDTTTTNCILIALLVSFQVMNCSGRIILSTESNIRLDYSQDKSYLDEYDLEDLTDDDLESENDVKSSSTNHFLVLIVDPIPHPSCTKTPLAGYSFFTKHTLDMKYTYVDEKYEIKKSIF
jgi:hypoxia-inducible factor 1 alpha